MNRSNEAPDPLAPLRQRIDTLDEQLVRLLNERARVVVEIGEIKRAHGVAPIYAPDREQVVLDRIRSANAGPLPDTCLEAIWRELMSGSFALERHLKIAYLGPAGSFSHLAARRQFGACVEYQALDSISAVFRAVESGQVDLGLVPIENSTGGGIHESFDCFMHTTARICAEALIPIHHHLLSQSEDADIKQVCSRPEIFEQCRRWLGEHLRHTEHVATTSSAAAAELAAKDPHIAAIGSSLAAEIYKLPVRHETIEDNPSNITRFFVIGNQASRSTGDDKTAILFTTQHKPGTLASVIDVFSERGVNLTHIDKRPSQRVNWEYYFFIDCEGHATESPVREALAAVREHCMHLTVLGSFPRARNVLE
ncbi:prephenate dehydratase [Planctomycetales bacterium ZRK34]|nr:prephenate dehydratase [Planctomycetales bacterium ZRK34]